MCHLLWGRLSPWFDFTAVPDSHHKATAGNGSRGGAAASHLFSMRCSEWQNPEDDDDDDDAQSDHPSWKHDLKYVKFSRTIPPDFYGFWTFCCWDKTSTSTQQIHESNRSIAFTFSELTVRSVTFLPIRAITEVKKPVVAGWQFKSHHLLHPAVFFPPCFAGA